MLKQGATKDVRLVPAKSQVVEEQRLAATGRMVSGQQVVSRTDSLTAAFGFFGDALFGTADRNAATQPAGMTLDSVNARLQGIETRTQTEPGGMNALRNGLVDDFFSHMPSEQSALRDLAHQLSDQFSANSPRGSGEREGPQRRDTRTPPPTQRTP